MVLVLVSLIQSIYLHSKGPHTVQGIVDYTVHTIKYTVHGVFSYYVHLESLVYNKHCSCRGRW